MDPQFAAIMTASSATIIALLGFVSVVYYKLGKLEGKVEAALEANKEFTRAEIQRLSDKLDTEIQRLSDKMDSGYAQLSGRMDAGYTQLSGRMDAGYAQLSARMDAEYARLSDRMDAEYARLSDRMDAQHAETISEIRRLVDAFLSHSHEPDGTIFFRVPPASGA